MQNKLSSPERCDKIKAMRNLCEKVILVWLVLLAVVCSAEPNDVNDPNIVVSGQAKAARIICTDMIDDGLFKSIQRRTDMAIADGATYLIYEIGTYGGLVQSADDIAKFFILETSKKARTVAFVKTEAISAGAMISVSCQDIIMVENTTIGDCAPIVMGGKLEGVEREKAESFIRAAFDRAAEANGYPKTLLRAMVSQQIEVWAVENIETGETEYFETERLPKDPNLWDLADKELIVKDDEILTLTAKRANELGIARAVVDNIDEALAFFEQRDGVTFTGPTRIYETSWSEQMVRFINSPAVMSILVLVALLGVYVEFNTPGLGLPGLVAVIAFTVIIGSKYLIGLANWFEVAVFAVGIILLLVELFVLPGFGVAGITGVICIVLGLVGMLVKNAPDEIPWPQNDLDWTIFTDGALGLIIGFVLFLIIAGIMAKYMPKFAAFTGLALAPAVAKTGTEFEVSMTGANAEGLNVGNVGLVVKELRPAGKAQFADAIADVLCQGEFLDKDTQVEIIEIRGNRVVVRKKED